MGFEFRLIVLALGVSALAGGASLFIYVWTFSLAQSLLAGLVVALVAAVFSQRWFLEPVHRLTRALENAIASYRDGDYSLSIRGIKHGAFSELTRHHAELGNALREQRQHLAQRELLLDTVVQHSPMALILVDDQSFVAYANLAARHLFNEGRSLNGLPFAEIVAAGPEKLKEVLGKQGDALFPLQFPEGEEVFHLSQRGIRLQGRVHRLYLMRRMTRELSRQEVATWKKVIRVMSHELNNSLAPISSMAHSGEELLRREEGDRVAGVLSRIRERSQHLQQFIESYAQFARLPEPRRQEISVGDLLAGVVQQQPVTLHCDTPQSTIDVDVTQMEQVLINLIKNAYEAGGPVDAIELKAERRGSSWRFELSDRGQGMTETVLANAVLPFYSTKRSGTGVGLALVREIVDAHGGHMDLMNRDGGGVRVRLTFPDS